MIPTVTISAVDPVIDLSEAAKALFAQMQMSSAFSSLVIM